MKDEDKEVALQALAKLVITQDMFISKTIQFLEQLKEEGRLSKTQRKIVKLTKKAYKKVKEHSPVIMHEVSEDEMFSMLEKEVLAEATDGTVN